MWDAPRTGNGYVWVFTSLEDVVFVYKLVSDFYAAYDFISCPQQKCPIYLIRDINQELLNNPFDEELQSITLPLSSLLRSDVATVNGHESKRRHLERDKGEVDEFFRGLAARPFRPESVQGFRERLERNRDELFTFIGHDGVPWNNNNAENAIERFAYYREGTVGPLEEAGLNDYLVLLSLYQTCRYKGVSFLKFLLSRERDIHAFCAGKRTRRRR